MLRALHSGLLFSEQAEEWCRSYLVRFPGSWGYHSEKNTTEADIPNSRKWHKELSSTASRRKKIYPRSRQTIWLDELTKPMWQRVQVTNSCCRQKSMDWHNWFVDIVFVFIKRWKRSVPSSTSSPHFRDRDDHFGEERQEICFGSVVSWGRSLSIYLHLQTLSRPRRATEFLYSGKEWE